MVYLSGGITMKKCVKFSFVIVTILSMLCCTLSVSAKYIGTLQLGSSTLVYTFLPGDAGICDFTPTESGTYKFYSTGSYDTVGYVTDFNDNTIAKGDDSYRGVNFEFDCYLQAGTFYYLFVGFADEQQTGSFYVVVEKAGPQGDLNSDGKKNNQDLALLMQKINKWNVKINTTAADTNCDGVINNKDYSLLMQYINGWKVKM